MISDIYIYTHILMISDIYIYITNYIYIYDICMYCIYTLVLANEFRPWITSKKNNQLVRTLSNEKGCDPQLHGVVLTRRVAQVS